MDGQRNSPATGWNFVVSKNITASTANGSRRSRMNCERPCTKNRFGSSWKSLVRPIDPSILSCRLHVCQLNSGETLWDDYRQPAPFQKIATPLITGFAWKTHGTTDAGGWLSMSVFLTKNSAGLRTSPVKRGYSGRPQTPRRAHSTTPSGARTAQDEADPGELTLPELLARHRDHTACAGCHQRFDSIGLVFEEYGPIGERRERDLAGHSIDARWLPDGRERAGIEGLS